MAHLLGWTRPIAGQQLTPGELGLRCLLVVLKGFAESKRATGESIPAPAV